MKSVLLLIVAGLCFVQPVTAALEKGRTLVKEQETPNPEKPDWQVTVWYRNGIKVMSQTPVTDAGVSLCSIFPFIPPKRGSALVIWFKNWRICRMYNNSLDGYTFEIADFLGDGIPDFIQFTDEKNHKVTEAYTIINGVVEPLPDDQFKKGREEFDYSDKVTDYIRQKMKKGK